MSLNPQVPEGAPKYTHYVSLTNGCIYPARDPASNYEDRHPADWRPASEFEVAAHEGRLPTNVAAAEVSLNALLGAGDAIADAMVAPAIPPAAPVAPAIPPAAASAED